MKADMEGMRINLSDILSELFSCSAITLRIQIALFEMDKN